MSTFALEEIEIPASKLKFFKLKEGKKCFYDEFVQAIEEGGNYIKELDQIYSYMQLKSRTPTMKLPGWEELKRDGKDPHKDYKFKTKNLRLYVFKDDDGMLIVLGNIKSPKTQDQDIERMRGIKKRYFEEQQNKKKK